MTRKYETVRIARSLLCIIVLIALCSASAVAGTMSTVTASPVPVLAANFIAVPLSGPTPLTVTFTDTSTGSPDYWVYDFGDGTTSPAKNSSHTYREPGNYTVNLTVMKISSEGLIRNTRVKQNLITVTGSPAPVLAANFTAVPRSGPTPLTVTFTDTSTGSPDYWNYDFGDGTTSPAKNPSHTYREPGNYTVNLTVMKSSSEGLIRNTTVKQNLIRVNGSPVPALAANFTAVPRSGPTPLAVTFTDTSTGSPDYWNYEFGDGTTSPAKNPSHTYREPGNYTVNLTVMKSSSEGLIRNTTVKQNLITVTGSPVPVLAANFTAVPRSGPTPLAVTFNDTSTGNPQFWNYEFGDGTSSTAKNPSHTYREPGNYTVNLTVMKIGSGGLIRNTTVKQNLITVTGSPVPALAANFTAVPRSGPTPLAVTFTDTSTGNPQFWNYEFGDGTSSTAKNPSHTYLLPGNYTVKLTVIKQVGSTLVRNTTTRPNLIRAV